MPIKKLSPKHKLAIRWFHWINFPILFIMIWSGTLIYWANDVYKLDAGVFKFQFYPEALYKSLNIPHRLAEGMSFHFLFMWIFFFNGLAYVFYLFFSGEWHAILPTRKSFKEAFLVLLHDLHLRKQIPPFKKYNAAQRIAYTAIVIMGFFSLVTGLAIYKPAQFPNLVSLIGGYEQARLYHFILTIGFVLFFLIHVVQVILAGWNNFRAMITGWEIVKEEVDPIIESTIINNHSEDKFDIPNSTNDE